MIYLLLLIGFLLLIKGADYFVEGASQIARRMNVSQALVGLTLVAFGTSAPEAVVSILAVLRGNPDISLGNIVGSNIFNVALIIGVVSLIKPLRIYTQTMKKEIPFMILTGFILFVLISYKKIKPYSENTLNRVDGLIFLLFLFGFLYYVYGEAKINREVAMTENEGTPLYSKIKSSSYTLGGLISVIIGGDMVVRSSSEIAYSLGMSQTLVGLTIVAMGTSLPELVTSIVATVKGNPEIALANIIGSNIFNILFILGVTSSISPISVSHKVSADVAIMILVMVLLWCFARAKGKITRRGGSVFIIFYTIYMIYIIIRN